jgi:flagellar hook assembly protein FlgD
LNLPLTPITDLIIRDNNLIVGTQGRSIYVLDDLSIIEQFQPASANKIFPVANTYRVPPQTGGRRRRAASAMSANVGINPMKGAVIKYYLANVDDSTKVEIKILDDQNKEIRTYSSKDKDGPSVEKGFNQFAWNLFHKELEQPEASFILWNGSTSPILAAPGKYTAKIKIDKQEEAYAFEIIADPNYKVSNADLKAQEQFLLEVAGSFKEIMNTLKGAKEIKTQIAAIQKKTKDSNFIAAAKVVTDSLTKIEEALHQTKAKSGQDVLNFPIRLDDKISGVFESAASGYVAPTKQVKETYLELKQQVDWQLKKYEAIKKENVKALNDKIHQLSIPIIGN